MATNLDPALVQRALKKFGAIRNQKSLLELMGKLDWDDSFDYKKERSRFKAVAKRLGCDPDLKASDKKLGKIARVKTTAKHGGKK
jgi:hypothetical protein